jgi:multidrug efflux pump subunit AcrB
VTLLSKDMAAKLPQLLLGGGVGAGATIALVLAEKEPKLLIETFAHWGAPSLIGLVAVVLLGQGISKGFTRAMDFGERMLQVGRDNAASQERLASAVNQIAQKDDERAREMELVVGQLARNSRQILDDIRELKQQFGGKANAHTAG